MPPKSHDPGRHVRVGREPRPRPALTGVAQLLAAQDGETRLAYACAEGRVLVELGWRMTPADKLEADAVARPLATLPGAFVGQALAAALRGEVTIRVAARKNVRVLWLGARDLVRKGAAQP